MTDDNNQSKKSKLIILGAGRPYRGEEHTVLRGASNQSRVFDWILQAVSPINPDVFFVGGYQIDAIKKRYPDLNYIVNKEWETTGAVASLLEAPLDNATDTYISYADIVFRDQIIQEMSKIEADIVVAADSNWRKRYTGRSFEDISSSEKLNFFNYEVTRLGQEIKPDLADAEFVGLVRASSKVAKYLHDNKSELLQRLKKSNLSSLIELLRIRGFSVKMTDLEGDWAELDETPDLARFILGTKAQTLDRLKGLVKYSYIEDQVSFNVSDWENAQSEKLKEIFYDFKDQYLVVRSSALSEDSFSSANAGAYQSVLNVNSGDEKSVIKAVNTVIESYREKNPFDQVLVQPMVQNVVAAGVVFTRTLAYGAPYYVINYDDKANTTDTITSGSSREHKTCVVYRNSQNYSQLPEMILSLLKAVQEIEELLDYDSLDIEFAISEKQNVHILQVRPIAVKNEDLAVSDDAINNYLKTATQQFRSLQSPTSFVVGKRTMFGVMPDWNPAEIIGTRPGRLAMSLYRHLIMDETWATQRAEYGYRDVRPQPLLFSFAGHPYVDIRASFNSFVPANIDEHLAERFINFYLKKLEDKPYLHDKVEFEIVPTCYGLNFANWEELLRNEGGFTNNEISCLRDELLKITCNAIERNPTDLKKIDLLESRFDSIMKSGMQPLERAYSLLEDCKQYGTLPFSHLARSAFVAVTLLKSAVSTSVITQEAADTFMNSIRTVTHMFTHDAAATANGSMTWNEFKDKYGHLRPGTYDITSPCYADDPEQFLKPMTEKAAIEPEELEHKSDWEESRNDFANALKKAGLPGDIKKVETFMREAIEGREYAKFAFTRNLSAALNAIAEFGEMHKVSRQELSNLPVEIFYALRTGTIMTGNVSALLRSRAEEGENARNVARLLELPPLLMKESDFECFHYPGNKANFVGGGKLSAECIHISNITGDDIPGLTGKIALIPQADPGFDWLFGRNIAGLITMYGGANSHMAIRAAEFGMPAAIGVGEVSYQKLLDAKVLLLDAGNKKIEIVR